MTYKIQKDFDTYTVYEVETNNVIAFTNCKRTADLLKKRMESVDA